MFYRFVILMAKFLGPYVLTIITAVVYGSDHISMFRRVPVNWGSVKAILHSCTLYNFIIFCYCSATILELRTVPITAQNIAGDQIRIKLGIVRNDF